EFAIEDEPPQPFTISHEGRLVFSNFKGNIEISSFAESRPIARLIQHIRANNQGEANQIAHNIRLQIAQAGKNLQFSTSTDGVQNDFTSTLIITLPPAAFGGVEIANASGSVKLEGLSGNHIIRDSQQIEIQNNTGNLTIDNPGGTVELSQIQGQVNLTGARGN